MMRMRQTHDLWHIVTGFDTSVEGELGLQAFMMSQVHSPLAPLLIGGQLLKMTFVNLSETRKIIEQVARGWTLGANAKQLFGFDWEDHWDVPLIAVKRQLNLTENSAILEALESAKLNGDGPSQRPELSH